MSDFSDNWLIKSKLRPPRLLVDILHRQRLERIFTSPVFGGVCFLEAPAGYGKTVLMGEGMGILSDQGCGVGWLTLDEEDQDPTLFLVYLGLAVAAAGVDFGGVREPSFQGEKAQHFSIRQIVHFIEMSGAPIALFLDDLHRAGSSEVLALVQQLINQLPENCALFIASRTRANLQLATMLAQGRLLQVTSRDLKYTFEESREVASFSAPDDETSIALKMTEGWPVIIQLLKAACRQSVSSGSGLPNLSWKTEGFESYLAEQVLQGLSDEIVEVLQCLSILERFNGDLINYLCNRGDGWEVLDQLVKENLLIFAIDGEGRWYRFHHLFGEYLFQELCRSRPTLLRKLHRDAAIWFAKNSLFQEAIRHAKRVEDPHLLAELLTRTGGWLLAFRGGMAILRIIESIPEGIIRHYVNLQLGRIYLLAQDHRVPEARAAFEELRKSTRNFRKQSDIESDELTQVYGATLDSLLSLYEAVPIQPGHMVDLERRVALLEGADDVLYPLVVHLKGYAYYSMGNYVEAKLVGVVALEKCRAVRANYVEVYGCLWMGDACLGLGEFAEAENYLLMALDRAQDYFGKGGNQTWIAKVFLAELAYEREQFDKAEEFLREALSHVKTGDAWLEVYASAYRVASMLAAFNDSWEAAVTLLETAAREVRAIGLRNVALVFRILRFDIMCQAGRLENARDMLDKIGEAALDKSVNPDNEGDARFVDRAKVSMARFEILSGNPAKALKILDEIETTTKQNGRVRLMMTITSLRAGSHCRLGDDQAAFSALKTVLHMALVTGAHSALFEEPMTLWPVLQNAAGRMADEFSEDKLYLVRKLLTQFELESERLDFAPGVVMGTAGPGISLSCRENEVLLRLGDGYSSKEIARDLNVAVNTVLSYRKSLYKKLGVNARSSAIQVGRQKGLLKG